MTLVCYHCGNETETGARCACGEPLWLKTDASEFSWPTVARSKAGLWRYGDLLPTEPLPGVGLTAGGTPLIRTERVDDYAGCRLWVKDESANPTGTFKDRGSAVGVARALETTEDEGDWVGTVSHGNMAMSMSAMSASAGVNCLVLVPDDIPAERLGHITQYDPKLVQVGGEYGKLYYDSLELPDVRFVNSDTPYRVAGQKTTALEICEAFATAHGDPAGSPFAGFEAESSDSVSTSESVESRDSTDSPTAPDAIVAPVSSGGHASAIWKALRELREANLLDSVPRLYFVQASACDPIAQAFRADADEVRPVQGEETVAYSIANSDPPSGNRVLAAVRDIGGAVLSVSDDEILDAKQQFARRAGLCVEPASATTLAGIRQLSKSGEISPDDYVVAIATGTGFREQGAMPTAPQSIPLADLAERVRSLVSGVQRANM
ncbi:threonine synthase [Haladaptatus litoreus]|uniref:Threonine synthase n=1 Tax=Haladaptatus litoreus TaxID=553468 RepID=A0A1N7E158_9EURY|nr:pyridoxal-phosphate dependent enzyme [Haladaptatus litoreus]SIR81794.1 threonine synthase [Haladaptatus litoreus]